MIQIFNITSLCSEASQPDTIIFYVFNKEKQERRFLDKYTILQFMEYSNITSGSSLFDRYDFYKIESMEEYKKLVYLNELIS